MQTNFQILIAYLLLKTQRLADINSTIKNEYTKTPQQIKTCLKYILFWFARGLFHQINRNTEVPVSVKSVSSFDDHMQKMLKMSPIQLFGVF